MDLTKTLRVMRLTAFLLLAGCLAASAKGVAQRITLNEKNVPLVKVLREIEKQSGYQFLYFDNDMKQARNVSISVKDKDISTVLLLCFNDQPLTYEVVDKTIVVKMREAPPQKREDFAAPPPVDITGKVVDEDGAPLAGVTITIKGTTAATTTNNNGEFSINSPDDRVTLVFSYTGYFSQELKPGTSLYMDVQLKRNVVSLDNLVVVGYGTQKKAHLTGAVDQVSSEYFENRPMPNIAKGLQGAIPNLNIRLVDGKPTRGSSFNIRGMTSVGSGGNALVLIDGVPGDPNNLNPNDVQSVTVLKDAASAALYGSRGVFGVVLITTKTAKTNKIQINYGANYSINSRTVTPELVNDGYTWAENFNDAFAGWYDYQTYPQNIDGRLYFSAAYLDSLKARKDNPSLPKIGLDPSGNYIYYENTDWLKELYRDRNNSMEHSLSIYGGSDRVKFAISGRYYTQDGIFRYNTDKFNRYNLRMKGEIKVNDWLTVNSNIEFSNYNYRYPLTAVGGVHSVWRLLAAASYPVAPLLNPDGTLTYVGSYSIGDFYYGKSFSEAKDFYNRNTIGFVATPFKNFTLKGDFSYLRTTSDEVRRYFPVPYSRRPGEVITSGLNYIGDDKNTVNHYVANVYGDYGFHLGDHNIKLMAGGNLELNQTKSMYMRRDGLLVDNLTDFNLATGTNFTINGGGFEWANAGIFYRANYAFRNKYLVELNGRYDGSSRFPTDQAFGFFPSASVGWVISREKFMDRTSSWLDQLKVRASLGALGNGNIAPYTFIPSIGIGTSAVIVNGRFPNYLQNPAVVPDGISWEKSTTLNLGADVTVMNNRLSITADIFERKTTDMITPGPPLPAVFGAPVPKGNFADLTTRGWELSVSWTDKIGTTKPFTYSLRATLADNYAVITKYYNPNKLLSTFYEGQRIGDIWGFVTDGFFTSAEDITNHADQSYFVVSNQNKPLPGDIKFRDLNKDGKVNIGKNTFNDPGDQQVIGNSAIRLPYAFTADLGWNNFSLFLFFQGIGKRDWFPSREASFFWGQMNRPYSLLPAFNLDRWTEENPDQDAYFPRNRAFVALSGTRELAIPQTRYLQNASYLRLKTVTLGYQLPQSLIRRWKLSSFNIYVTGQNLWTFSPMYRIQKNFDPEVIELSD